MKFKTNQKISRLKHQINSIYMSLGQTADIFPILITLLRSYFIINMNFDNDDAIDTLIGRLIAFIIMFEKKVSLIPCRSKTLNAKLQGANAFIHDWLFRSQTCLRRTKQIQNVSLEPWGTLNSRKNKQAAAFFSESTPKTTQLPMMSNF